MLCACLLTLLPRAFAAGPVSDQRLSQLIRFFPHFPESIYVPLWMQLSKWNMIQVRAGRCRRAGRFLLLFKAVASRCLNQHTSDLPQREELALYLCKSKQNNLGSFPQGILLRSYMTVMNIFQITKSCGRLIGQRIYFLFL